MENIEEVQPIGPRWLSRTAEYMAYAGGVVMIAVLVVSVTSIAGRSFLSKPILGDYEIVERVTAVAIAWFLPYCQLVKGHVLVDFFTRNITARVRASLDLLATILVLGAVSLITWRTSAGLPDLIEYGETSMNLGVPTWIPVALLMPGLVMFAVASLFSIAHFWRAARS